MKYCLKEKSLLSHLLFNICLKNLSCVEHTALCFLLMLLIFHVPYMTALNTLSEKKLAFKFFILAVLQGRYKIS